MRNGKIVGAGALVIVAGAIAAGMFVREGVGQRPGSMVAAAQEGGPLEQHASHSQAERELAEMRSRLFELERRLDSTTGEKRDEEANRSKPKPADLAEVLSPEERSARRLSRFEERFMTEPADPPRDAAEAARLMEAMAASDELRETHPIRVECRSTACRIEVEHDSEEAFHLYREKFPEMLGTGGTYVRLLERGPRYRSVIMHFDSTAG